MDVSVIIVNFNTKQLLENCISSIYQTTDLIEFEIIVSDNASTDGSAEYIKKKFPNVIYILNKENYGFGKANNEALKYAKGKYIFYLNSDTILLNNSIKAFFDYFEKNPEIGALGSNLLNTSGEVIHSYGIFPTFMSLLKILIRDIIGNFVKLILYLLRIKIDNLHYRTHTISKKIGEVDYITGADLFLKNDENAFFDENFILYYEEVDLQYQLMKKSKTREIIEGPKIIHLEGGSSSSNKKRSFCSFGNMMSYISMYIYCRKNISKYKAFFLQILICILWINPLYLKCSIPYFRQLFRKYR